MSCFKTLTTAAVVLLLFAAVQAGKWSTVIPATRSTKDYLAIACKTDHTCYVSGMGGAATFNGKSGETKLTPIGFRGTGLPNAMAAGGETVVAAESRGSVDYLSSNATFMPSKTPIASPYTQGIDVTSDGKVVVTPILPPRGGGIGDVMVSHDGGVNFVNQSTGISFHADTGLSVSVVSAKVWYIAGGVDAGDGIGKANSAIIVRTLNGGKSYETVYSSSKNFFFSSIDCLDANTCVAAANANTDNPGVYIYRTTDGTSWSEVFHLPNGNSISPQYPMYSTNKVMFAGNRDVWVLGSVTISRSGGHALYFESHDAGASFKRAESFGIVTTNDATFLPDGTGYAVGTEQNRDYSMITVEKYTP